MIWPLLVQLGLQAVVLGLLRGRGRRGRYLAELRFKHLEALLSRVVLLIELSEQLLLLGLRVLGTVLEKGSSQRPMLAAPLRRWTARRR